MFKQKKTYAAKSPRIPDTNQHIIYAKQIREREAIKRTQLEEKKQRELQRKKTLEINRKKIAQVDHEYHALAEIVRRQRLEHAAKAREKKLHEEHLRRIANNTKKELLHAEKKMYIDQDRKEGDEALRNMIEQRHSVAQERFLQSQLEKERAIRKKAHDDEMKRMVARTNLLKLENQMEEWRQALDRKQQEAEEKAARVNNENMVQRQMSIKAKRNQNVTRQSLQYQKIKDEQESYNAVLRENIYAKNARVDVIKEEKEKTIRKSKELSRQSANFNSGYFQNDETFNEKVRKAELENAVLFNSKHSKYM